MTQHKSSDTRLDLTQTIDMRLCSEDDLAADGARDAGGGHMKGLG